MTDMVPIMKFRTLMNSFAPFDGRWGRITFLRKCRRTARSGNLRSERLQALPEFGVHNFPQPFAKLFGHHTKLRTLGPLGLKRRLSMAKDDTVDRGIAEEAIYPLNDHGCEMLEKRCVRPFHGQ